MSLIAFLLAAGVLGITIDHARDIESLRARGRMAAESQGAAELEHRALWSELVEIQLRLNRVERALKGDDER